MRNVTVLTVAVYNLPPDDVRQYDLMAAIEEWAAANDVEAQYSSSLFEVP